MKWNEFNRKLNESAKFNIPDNRLAIDAEAFLHENPRNGWNWLRIVSYTLSALVLVMTLSLYLYLNNTTFTTLTIDFNPSFTVQMNGFGRVKGTEAINSDAISFLAEIDSHHMTLDEFLDAVYTKAMDDSYFTTSDAFMLVGVFGVSYEEEAKVAITLSLRSDIETLSVLSHLNTWNDTDALLYTYTTTSTVLSSEDQSWLDSIFGEYVMESGVPAAASPTITTAAMAASTIPAYTTTATYDNPDIPDDPGSIDSTDYYSIDYDNFQSLADQLGISITKLTLVSYIFDHNSDYLTETDFMSLVDMDIQSLIEIYQDMSQS
ncbi:MAG: hypothetical protein JXB08_06375 [Bacilli bacterium]|nr:hypothetical protein [Bacilli bacterium]MBN2876592.1 hypothetical protein [Bacilli bacterium]